MLRRSYAFDRFAAPAAVLDASGVVLETNEAWRLFSALNEATPGTTGPGVDYLRVCDESAAAGVETARLVAEGLRAILRGDRASYELEYPCPSPMQDRWFLIHASGTPVDDGSGVVMFHVNVTARKLLEERLDHESGRDPTTGLMDVGTTRSLIDNLLARAAVAQGQLTAIHVRIDGLETVDKDCGRPASDELLMQVIARAGRVVRANDDLCRVGAYELVVVCPDLDDEAGIAVADRLRDVITAPFQVGASEVSLGVAVGRAASDATSTADGLLAAAASAAGSIQRRGIGCAPNGPWATTTRLPHSASRSVPPAPGEVGASGAVASRSSDADCAQRDAVVAHSSDLVLYFEQDGEIAWASPAALALFGMDAETLVGRNGLTMIHPDDQARVFSGFAAITEYGDHVRLEFRVVLDDGEIYWIEETATNLIQDPHVGYIVGNLQNVTARKRDEDAIRLRSRLLDAAGQAIVAVDLDGNVIYWNAGATRTYGWTADETYGQPVRHLLVPAADWVHEARAVRDLIVGGEPWTGDCWVHRKDGVEIPVLVTNEPVYDGAGTRIATISVASDISERKQHETEQARLSEIVASSTDAIFETAIDGTVTSWNRAAEELYGYSADEMIGHGIQITIPADRFEELDAHFRGLSEGRRLNSFETVRVRSDGTHVPVSISIFPVRDAAGEVVAAAAIVRDVTESVRLRQALEADRQRLADAQRLAHLGSFEMDMSTHTVTWSDELQAILGLPSDTPPGPAAFRARVHPEDREHFEAKLIEAMSGQPDVECTHRIVRPDGEVRWVTIRTSNVDASSSRVSGTVLDITDRKQLELDLWHQAAHDALTGLANRRLLLEQLDAALSAGDPADPRVGLVLFDVDRFKLINDSLGHDRGDQVLIAIGDALQELFDRGEIVARFGSDTFVVATRELTDPSQALDLAERIRTRLAEGVLVGAESYTPTVSLGIVIANPGDDAITLLRDADTAMYRAKERGRDRAEWFDPSIRRAVVASFELERELRHAIEHGGLHVVYQPVLDMETNRICGCEALVRWQHPERGALGPDEFIPVAESTGLIVPLGGWVLRQALDAVAGWPDPLYVAVNLAPRQLAEPDLFARVLASLADAGVPPTRLVLEVTETAVLQDPTAAARTISALRAFGVRVVIDDFGTGYTSLSFLRDYRLDGLKIDRSFIMNLEYGSSAIVDAILAWLARSDSA